MKSRDASAKKYNYRLLLQYDGTDYFGWQIQPQRRSIQGTVKTVIERVAGESIVLIGSGRTDAGVHARGQVANFHTRLRLPAEAWRRALNNLLPADIRVSRVARVPCSFHALRDATAKTYHYHVFTGRILPPWESRFCLHWTRPLNLEEMTRAASMLLDCHDVRSFAASGTAVKSFVRRINSSAIRLRGPRLTYTIQADGFLQHMVRSITGTLLEVGSGRFTAGDFQTILAAADRKQAGTTAPPQGLFLHRVHYRPIA